MFSKFLPREAKFFMLFSKLAITMIEGANALKELFSDIPNADRYARQIKEIEHRADEITHNTISLLHETFITPIDREDIHQLIRKLDDVVDFFDAAAQRTALYDVKKCPPGALELINVCIKQAEAMKRALDLMEGMKDREKILKECVELHRLENEADHVFRTSVAKLFREESDIRELIKYKEIYEILETATDRGEDVANLIEGIVLEYA